jgi:hypothetical protein
LASSLGNGKRREAEPAEADISIAQVEASEVKAAVIGPS